MKLIVGSADFGMLDCVTDGTMKCIRDGILTTVNVHTNNPSAARASKEIKEFPRISIGQEINFVSGVPVSSPNDIPTLVNQEGRFLTSRERQQKNLGDYQISYDDAYTEATAQIERFIELYGRNPVYVNGHSYGTETTRKAIADAADHYHILLDGFNEEKLKNSLPNWYRQVPGNKSAYTMQMQLETDVEQWILEDRMKLLNREYGSISTHCGFCDEELVRMSSFNVIRYKEVFALTSSHVKKWIKDNDIVLISLEQFYEENNPDYEKHRQSFLAPHPEWGKQAK